MLQKMTRVQTQSTLDAAGTALPHSAQCVAVRALFLFFLLLLRGAMLQVSAGPYPPTSGCGEVRNSQPEEMFESEPDISQLIVQSESGDRPSGPVDWFWMLVKNHRCILLYCTFFPSREAV